MRWLLNTTSWTPELVRLFDNNMKTFAVICVVIPIIVLSIVTAQFAVTYLLERLVHHVDGFNKRLILRIKRIVREHSPMLILMVYLECHTTIFEQYPLAKALMWVTYVVIFCMDDLDYMGGGDL